MLGISLIMFFLAAVFASVEAKPRPRYLRLVVTTLLIWGWAFTVLHLVFDSGMDTLIKNVKETVQ